VAVYLVTVLASAVMAAFSVVAGFPAVVAAFSAVVAPFPVVVAAYPAMTANLPAEYTSFSLYCFLLKADLSPTNCR